MKYKIAMISTAHQWNDVRIFEKEASTLAQAGYDVVIIARGDKLRPVNNIHVKLLPAQENRFKRMILNGFRAFQYALRERADVYHFHDPEFIPWGLLLRAVTRSLVVFDIHENVRGQILSKEWIPKWARRAVSTFYGLVETITVPFFSGLVLARPDLLEVPLYTRNKNAVLIRNLPRKQLYKPIEPSPSETESIKHSRRFVYLGAISRIRGIFQLLEACKILRAEGETNFELLLIGPFQPPSLGDEVLKYIADNSLGSIVTARGPMPYREALSELHASVAGLVTFLPAPNHESSEPTKFFEYMMAGVPVVASHFPSWRKLLAEEQCGISVDPLDPRDIARGMKWVLENPEEARAMGLRGKLAVETRLNWEAQETILLSFYRNLIDKRYGRP